MSIELDAGGRLTIEAPQQRWSAGPAGEAALFAGQTMVAVPDGAGGFDLHYLGFMTTGFKTIDIAKLAAPEFARRVLARMSAMIAD